MKRKHVIEELANSDEEEVRHHHSKKQHKKRKDDSDSDAEPKKQRHSTGSAFGNAFNSIMGDSLLVDDYCNSENLPLGIKFKVVLRSFRQMTIIEKFFIFNKLHNISYSTITESDCIALLSLGFSQISDDEIDDLQTYFRTMQKSPNHNDSKYTLFDFENQDTRLYWQLSYQTWVTFYHDMVDCYTTRYTSSKNPNEISTSFNDSLEFISRDSNFYVKAMQLIRKKLRHIPGKTSGRKEMIKLYNNLNEVLSTMSDGSVEKIDGIHMINEKVLSANFYFHFLQSEDDKKNQLANFFGKNARVRDYVENVKINYPLTTKTSLSSISISLLNLEKSIRFFNEFIKPRESSLVKSIRGTHIKIQFSNYGRKEEANQSVTSTSNETQLLVNTPSSNHQDANEKQTTPLTNQPSAQQIIAKPIITASKPTSIPAATHREHPVMKTPTESMPTIARSDSENIPPKPLSVESTTDTNSSPSSRSSKSATIVIDEDEEDSEKIDAVEVFRNWWMGEYKNFDFSKHQAALSTKRLLQFFSVAMRQKDPTFHMDSSHANWRLIRKAIEKGEIIGLRVEEGGRSFKVVN